MSDTLEGDEFFVGGMYYDVKTHYEEDIKVIDSCSLIGMSIIPDIEVADKNLKIRRIEDND